MSDCQCELSGFCKARDVEMRPSLQMVCRKDKARVDAMLAGEKPESKGPSRTPGSVVSVSRKPCSTCGSGAFDRAMRRLTNLKNAVVDFVSDGMHVASDEQQAKRSVICTKCPLNNSGWCDDTRGGCGCNLSLKVQPRSSSCPLGRWAAYRDEYRPLVNPTRHLMFHIYPLRGKEWNWHKHIERIREHRAKFNGKVVIGVGVDEQTATIEEVQRLFDGIHVDHWLRADNNKLAETLTHVEMLTLLQTDDPNAIIFRGHTKGVTKTEDAVEQKWADILWAVNIDLASVEDALASHLTCGAMRSQTPLVVEKPGDFFFAGSYYWMRAKEVFERDWTWKERNRWIVEYVPCHLFTFAESACIFHDMVPSSVLNHGYFSQHVDTEWANWKAARGIQ